MMEIEVDVQVIFYYWFVDFFVVGVLEWVVLFDQVIEGKFYVFGGDCYVVVEVCLWIDMEMYLVVVWGFFDVVCQVVVFGEWFVQ